MGKKSRKKAIHARKLGIGVAASATTPADSIVAVNSSAPTASSAAASPAASAANTGSATVAAAATISKSARRNKLKKRAADRKREEARTDDQQLARPKKGPARKHSAAASSSGSSALAVLYEDEDVLAIDKPDGMLAHPSPGFWDHGTVLHALEARERVAGHSEIAAEMLCERVGATGEWDSAIPRVVVHRLDRGTTGVMILAKTPLAEAHLAAQFRQRTTRKRYVAVLSSAPSASAGERAGSETLVDAPIAPDPARRGAVVVSAAGKQAKSIVHLHAFSAEHGLALVSVDLLTGRQHQIRAHCAHRGAPLANDDLYGGESAAAAFRQRFGPLRRGRPLLHAWSLKVPHLRQERSALELCAPLPPDMRRLIERLWPQLGTDPAGWPALSFESTAGAGSSSSRDA